ncbi:MAG: TIGR03862 family flavoprotein [Pseudomonadota bacterium]
MLEPERCSIAIVGAGPAGLAASEAALAAGVRPLVLEVKPSVARKWLMAGKSGLNLTKEETPERFLAAYGAAAERLAPMLAAFGAAETRAWAEGLGEAMYTGSSGRVFPRRMKGSPLLRRWLARLESAEIRTRWRWTGWEGEALAFETPDGPRQVAAEATVLALGGASWPRLGSDAAWVPWLEKRGVTVTPFKPANMGFDVSWSAHLVERHAGQPLKPVRLTAGDHSVRGECVVTAAGLEGSAVYTLSAVLRDRLGEDPVLWLDLAPDRNVDDLAQRLAQPRGRASLANHLRKRVRIEGVKAALLRECAPKQLGDPLATAQAIKALPVTLLRPRPLTEAISAAGGVAWADLTDGLALRPCPAVFCAGEMLDWEAPTGGYLLTACLATGFWAGRAAAKAALP